MGEAEPPSTQEAASFYDEMWQRYAHLDQVSPAAFHRRRVVAALARAASPRAARVLDAGCGQGELLETLVRALPGSIVDGADVSEQSVADSRRRNPSRDLFTMDLSAADFERVHSARLGAYDLVVCSEVVEHIGDDAGAVRNVKQLMAPGGHLIVTVPGGKMSRFDRAIGHHRHYRARDLRSLLVGAGLDVDRVLAWGFPFHNLYRSAVRLASSLSLPERGEGGAGSSDTSGVLGAAYTAFSKILRPLFYLNGTRWGEQMIALARRPR